MRLRSTFAPPLRQGCAPLTITFASSFLLFSPGVANRSTSFAKSHSAAAPTSIEMPRAASLCRPLARRRFGLIWLVGDAGWGASVEIATAPVADRKSPLTLRLRSRFLPSQRRLRPPTARANRAKSPSTILRYRIRPWPHWQRSAQRRAIDCKHAVANRPGPALSFFYIRAMAAPA